MKFQMIVATTALSLTTAIPAKAVTVAQLEVAGIRIGDKIASVTPKLVAKGYRNTVQSLGKCNGSYQTLINEALKKRQTRIDGRVTCEEEWRKPGSGFSVGYLVSPAGYIVDSVGYQFDSPQTAETIGAQLSAKFGRPDVNEYGLMRWKIEGVSEFGAQYFNRSNSNTHSIEINGNMQDTVINKMNQEIVRRLGPIKNDL